MVTEKQEPPKEWHEELDALIDFCGNKIKAAGAKNQSFGLWLMVNLTLRVMTNTCKALTRNTTEKAEVTEWFMTAANTYLKHEKLPFVFASKEDPTKKIEEEVKEVH